MVCDFLLYFFYLKRADSTFNFFLLSSPQDIQESPPPVPKLETWSSAGTRIDRQNDGELSPDLLWTFVRAQDKPELSVCVDISSFYLWNQFLFVLFFCSKCVTCMLCYMIARIFIFLILTLFKKPNNAHIVFQLGKEYIYSELKISRPAYNKFLNSYAEKQLKVKSCLKGQYQ